MVGSMLALRMRGDSAMSEACNSGRFLEGVIQREFAERKVPVFDWCLVGNNGDIFERRFLLRNVPYTNLYGGPSRSEFVYRDFYNEIDIRIECRWQEVPGSVDEKFPYLLLNARHAMPESEVWLIVDGSGARQRAINWFRGAAADYSTDGKIIRALTLPEARQHIRATLRSTLGSGGGHEPRPFL
jgi:hypothetical protein